MLYTMYETRPSISKDAWIANSAELIGDVHVEKDASIFFQSVLRGDAQHIEIGEGSNIQDQCTLHCDPTYPLTIGKRVSVGHGCVLHGCHIEDETLVGMGAIIMDGAQIGTHCIVGAGALVCENMKIEDGSIVMGIPAKIVKKTSQKQIDEIKNNALHYIELSKEYKKQEDK